MKTSLIWDLDGTLLDSYNVIVNAVYFVCQKYDINITKEEIKKEAMKASFSINIYNF
jgi:phosphoglycolate phosphatase-like HAD superfamily hydrolase